MLTTREVIKTFYNALLQRLKKHRGDWNQNDPTADDYIKNRPFYTDDTKKVIKLDRKYLPDLGLAPVATSGNYYDLKNAPTVYSDVVRYNGGQNLSGIQKEQARVNIGAISSDEVTGVVKYTAQSLTDTQKQQARTNIGAISSDEVTGVGADVVKGSYKLRIGQAKYAGYGFAILYGESVQMNYTNTGIYDENSGSTLNMSGQSVFRARKGSHKHIVIQTEADNDSEEPKIVLSNKNGGYISISADGTLYYSGNILRVGTGPGYRKIVRYVNTPEEEYDAATKGYVDGKISDTEIFLKSSTPDSTKKFRIAVDDSGALTTEAVTE